MDEKRTEAEMLVRSTKDDHARSRAGDFVVQAILITPGKRAPARLQTLRIAQSAQLGF